MGEVYWVAEVFPDWTTLQIVESGDAFAFNRATGRVYKLPHPDCPFIQILGEVADRTGRSRRHARAPVSSRAAVPPQPVSYWHKAGLNHECPKCRGCGGWIIKADQYGEGRHFMASCNDCNGWGYTDTPANHPHEWDSGANVGQCLNRYTCTVCGITSTVDSSD